MEYVSRDFEGKPVRHTFDKKAFRKYSVSILLLPLLSFLAQMLFFLIGRRHDLLDLALQVGIQALAFAAALISFLTMLYTLKSSDVFTAPGCVLYRKRRLFTSQFDGVRYIVYHIADVKSVKGEKKYPVVVKGNINAVYVLEDGNTINSYKTCRKATIPPCFTDMEMIRETLEAIETQGVTKSSSRFATY